MEREGWRVVRFWANQVIENPEGTWAEIEQILDDARSPNLSPYGAEEYKKT